MRNKQIHVYMLCCQSTVYSIILMSDFVIKENTENVEPSTNFISGTLVSSLLVSHKKLSLKGDGLIKAELTCL